MRRRGGKHQRCYRSGHPSLAGERLKGIMIALASLLLALCATPNGILLLLGVQPPVSVPQEAWSLFANVLEYALVAGFFVIEYAIRRRRVPQQPFTGLRDFTTRLLAVAPAAFDPGRRRAGMGKHA